MTMKPQMEKSLTIVGDDGILTRQAVELATLVGYTDLQCIQHLDSNASHLFFAIQDRHLRAELIESVNPERLINLIHPTAVVSGTAKLMNNIMVGAQAVVGSNARVASGVIQNALSSIEHDNRIGAHTFLGTGAILCGNVSTGEFVFVGGGATVKPGVTIGAHTTIGTGAVLIKDALDNSTYVGNPARAIGR